MNSLPSAKPATGLLGRSPRITFLRPSRAHSEGFTPVCPVHMPALPAEACPERTAGRASYSFELPLPWEVFGLERPIGGNETTISRKRPGEKQGLHTQLVRSACPKTRESLPPDMRRPCLDFTQNLEKAMDAIALARRQPQVAPEGFSLSVADPDIQEPPVARYHPLADSLACAA